MCPRPALPDDKQEQGRLSGGGRALASTVSRSSVAMAMSRSSGLESSGAGRICFLEHWPGRV